MKLRIISALLTLLVVVGIPLFACFFGMKVFFAAIATLFAIVLLMFAVMIVYEWIYEALEDLFQ
jgi:hypothetical protein